MFNLHIAIKAENGVIYEELGNCENVIALPSLYDTLATRLQVQVDDATTRVDPQDPEPKITLIRQVNTFYDSLDEFAEALKFLEANHDQVA